MVGGQGVGGFLELTRPLNAVVAGGLTIVGAYVAGGVFGAPVQAAVAGIATVLATGAGNAINDYFDREIDAVNDPDRPIPRGAVTPRAALWFSGGLFTVAVAMVLWLPLLAIAIAGVNLLALVTYTEWFKGRPGLGNALVAYLGGSTFLFGAAAVEALGVAAAVLAVLAAVATFGREVIKDVEDIVGDREAGLETLPIVIGERRALGIATLAVAIAVLASPLPYIVGGLGISYLVVVLPGDFLMLLGAHRSWDDPATGHQLLKWGMFAAAGAFIVGRTVGVASGGLG